MWYIIFLMILYVPAMNFNVTVQKKKKNMVNVSLTNNYLCFLFGWKYIFSRIDNRQDSNCGLLAVNILLCI